MLIPFHLSTFLKIILSAHIKLAALLIPHSSYVHFYDHALIQALPLDYVCYDLNPAPPFKTQLIFTFSRRLSFWGKEKHNIMFRRPLMQFIQNPISLYCGVCTYANILGNSIPWRKREQEVKRPWGRTVPGARNCKDTNVVRLQWARGGVGGRQ